MLSVRFQIEYSFYCKSEFQNCVQRYIKYSYLCFGKLAEWSIAAVLKTVDVKASGGSNPSLSAYNVD